MNLLRQIKMFGDRALQIEIHRIRNDFISAWSMLGHSLVERFLGNFGLPPETDTLIPQIKVNTPCVNVDDCKTTRTEIGPLIEYETTCPHIQPGTLARIHVGMPIAVDGTGWPGVPETAYKYSGMIETLKPVRITISAGFVLRSMYIGGIAACRLNPDGPGVPSEVLAEEPQPEFPICPKGIAIAVQVENTSDEPRPLAVRVLGLPVQDSNASAPSPPPQPDPANDKVA